MCNVLGTTPIDGYNLERNITFYIIVNLMLITKRIDKTSNSYNELKIPLWIAFRIMTFALNLSWRNPSCYFIVMNEIYFRGRQVLWIRKSWSFLLSVESSIWACLSMNYSCLKERINFKMYIWELRKAILVEKKNSSKRSKWALIISSSVLNWRSAFT